MTHGHALRGFGFRAMSRGRRGPGPWRGAHWGMGPEGFGPPFGRRPRMRRGDVRAALLVLLDEEPRNGYALMQEIEQRSDGAWRPSPGSIYPALAQLEDEGLVQARAEGTGRVFELTEAGKAEVEAKREEFGEPWNAAGRGLPEDAGDMRASMKQLAVAFAQVMQAGTKEQRAEAAEVMADARKALYRILAGK